jgi:hypothetical protein
MTTPTPPTYYNDYVDSTGVRQPLGRCPRVLDIYFSGPNGCGYIFTPPLYRNSTAVNGGTLSLMICAETGMDITKSGPTGIQVAYKLALNGSDFNVGSTFYNTPSIGLTQDNTKGITLGRGMAIAIGVCFGNQVLLNVAHKFYIVNQTPGNSGELIWRMTYVTDSASGNAWYQHGPHASNMGTNNNSDGLGPPLLYSYGASISGENGKTGYTGSHPSVPLLGSANYPGSAQFTPYKVKPIL